jgi:hypothetical protein
MSQGTIGRDIEPFAAGGLQDAARDRRSVQMTEAPCGKA